MKRFLVLLVVIAVLAVPALFADVKVGGWGRVYTQVSGSDVDGSDVLLDQKPGWNGAGARVRFDVLGSSDQIGFAVEVNTDIPAGNYYGGNIGLGDRILIWIKPIDMLKIEAGRVGTVDQLRGKFGSSHGSGVAYHGNGDFQDNIFARTRVNSGIVFELAPVEGLNVIAALEIPDDTAMEDVVKQVQVGAGYTIEGIGTIRLQYIGEGMLLNAESVQVAFALTAVEGLLVDLGACFDTSDAEDPMFIAIGASYQINDAIKISTSDKIILDDDPIVSLFIEGSYSLGAVSIVLDVAADLTQDAMQISVFPYALMGLGNGKASLGFRVDMAIDAEVTNWYIPLLMEYWF
jgi:hypothetical protein